MPARSEYPAGREDRRQGPETLPEHVEFGARAAQQDSRATAGAELNPLREVPRWTWPGE
jgi:hemoglobin